MEPTKVDTTTTLLAATTPTLVTPKVKTDASDGAFPKEVIILVCIVGIFVCYGAFGVAQEELYSGAFGPHKERFNNTIFLLFVQSVTNSLIAWIASILLRGPVNKTPLLQYSTQALSSLMAMVFSNLALTHVDYPTQVLAKSCKPVPVMIMTVFILRKRYRWDKVLYVTMITAGISLFMLSKVESPSSPAYVEKKTSTLGMIFLLCSLGLDGVTGPMQEKLVTNYNPTSVQLMLYSNLWSSGFLLLAMLGTGAGIEGVLFCKANTDVLPYILLFSITSAFGQFFIYYTVHQFGSLTCSIITTIRKFCTILLSVLLFGHLLTVTQWLCVALVFCGLGLESFFSWSAHKKKEK